MLKRVAAAMVAVLLASAPARAVAPYDKAVTVSATTTNASTTFDTRVSTLLVINDGSAAAFYELNGAASASTGIRLNACEGHKITFAGGQGPTSLGVITSSSTATVRVVGFYDPIGGTGAPFEYLPPSTSCTTPVWTAVTAAAITDSALTSGRIPIAGTGGLLGDDADLSFATDTLTATKVIADAAGNITAGTMTPEVLGEVRERVWSYTWTNAMVVALGAGLTGDITVGTLPAKLEVRRALVVVTGAATGPTTLTMGCGVSGALYIDYVVASDLKAAANTVYGDAVAEVGTALDGLGEGLPSYTATTAVKCHLISTVLNLDQVVGSTGRVVLVTRMLQ